MPKKEIDTGAATSQIPRMATKAESLIPTPLRHQMRPENIGRRLKLFREAIGMTQAEISDSLGLPRPYWNRFEKGERAVSDHVAAILMSRYGLSLDFLIYGDWSNLPLGLAEKMREIEASGPGVENN